MDYDLVVIGAGPGGYPAAIRAAQLGKSVALIDRGNIGGECLNWGCIPSKTIIAAANQYHKAYTNFSEMGINFSGISLDFAQLMQWKASIQRKLINGIRQLLRVNEIKLIIGDARIIDEHHLTVNEKMITFDSLILATGSSFISPPGLKVDENTILSAKGLLSVDSLPQHLVCIGGGIIGLELGIAFAKLGSRVTVVELLPQIMTGVPKRLLQPVKKTLKELGIQVHLKTMAKSLDITTNGVNITLDHEGKTSVINADKVLIAIGKKPDFGELIPRGLGIELDQGYLKVDELQRTSIPNIYAVGDCTGMPFLAHRATHQGIVAAEALAGIPSQSHQLIPNVIFTDPEIAYAGLSQNECKEQGIDFIVSRTMFASSGMALAKQEGKGMVQVIAHKETKEILGVQIVGPDASDLIAQVMSALDEKRKINELTDHIYAHPTLSEILHETLLSLDKRAIHTSNIR